MIHNVLCTSRSRFRGPVTFRELLLSCFLLPVGNLHRLCVGAIGLCVLVCVCDAGYRKQNGASCDCPMPTALEAVVLADQHA